MPVTNPEYVLPRWGTLAACDQLIEYWFRAELDSDWMKNGTVFWQNFN